MTQGIPYRTRSYDLAPTNRARVTPTTEPDPRKRPVNRLVSAFRTLWQAIARRRAEEVPHALVEDVGLGGHATSRELRSEFTRHDALLHARFH